MVQIFSRILRVCCALAMFAACMNANAQEHSPAEQRMVGTWLGEFANTGTAFPLQRFLTTRKDDGTFLIVARLYENGKMIAETHNAGLWGISNGIYFTVTTDVNGKRSDPKLPEAINAYLVQSLTADRFEYVHVATGRHFIVTRADAATARLPD